MDSLSVLVTDPDIVTLSRAHARILSATSSGPSSIGQWPSGSRDTEISDRMLSKDFARLTASF